MSDTTIDRNGDVNQPDDDDGVDEIVDDEAVDDDGELWIDDAEFVYVPKESGFFRKAFVALVMVGFLVVGVIGYGGYWAIGQLRGTGEQGAKVAVFTIPEGSNMAQASVILEEKRVIKNATFFRYYAKYKSLSTVKAGDYDKFFENMQIDDVIKVLRDGPLPQEYKEMNIPEGFTVASVNNRIIATYPEITAASLQDAEFKMKSKYGVFRPPGEFGLEGFLFPATYRVDKSDYSDAGKLIDQMTGKFDAVADELGLDKAAEKIGGAAGDPIGPYQVMIVASMIEKEAKVDEDRAKIARVIYNRLQRKMTLGIDATILYCPGLQGKTELTKSDLESDCPFNTRKVRGLPPTPIANPGKKSLQAALNPEPGPWLYYVLSDADGHHFFTDKESEFARAVQEARSKGLL